METETEMEISLKQLLNLVWKNITLILVCAVAATAVAFCITSFAVRKTYVSTVKLYVSAPAYSNNNSVDAINELNYAQKVVNTYIEMLRTNSFYQKISDAMDAKYSVEQLEDMIVFSTLNDTEVFEATVSAHEPHDAKQIADLITSLSPATISQLKEDASLKVVDPPTFSDKPASPNVPLFSVIGAILGIVGAVIFVLLRDILDVRIKNEDDLAEHYEIPILASIPYVSVDPGTGAKNRKVKVIR